MAPDNVLLPACPAGLRRAVFTTASSLGLTWSLVTELFGRSVAELVLEQVGGRTRLRPGNEHQLPHVLVLAGPHLQGALGVALARHLWSRRCRVTLVAPQLTIGEMEPPEEMEQQLELFRMLTGETVHSDFDGKRCCFNRQQVVKLAKPEQFASQLKITIYMYFNTRRKRVFIEISTDFQGVVCHCFETLFFIVGSKWMICDFTD